MTQQKAIDILKSVFCRENTITKKEYEWIEKEFDKIKTLSRALSANNNVLEKCLVLVGWWDEWNEQNLPYQVKVLEVEKFLRTKF